ncbi:uncharacterized protein F5147DRAFT_761992 [Suillus discolor]|uniref:Uncharacterized protein n=1 Tax=Suillus discolor TaxID=1912936 RepID=A0A9P7F4P0_9AGAM|nr:uncharacterized protein F5147DRAFT_761992 [Suillus discolor]KAG2105077.1 hypothetical protein F5147DRAFT_761992 [Suillus discolor]
MDFCEAFNGPVTGVTAAFKLTPSSKQWSHQWRGRVPKYYIGQVELRLTKHFSKMPSTASQLERSLRRLQISESDSQETSTAVQWVPSKYSSDVSQYVLVKPPRAPCGNRWLFGFPIVKKELWNMGTIAFKQIWPDKTLPDNNAYIAMNSLTFLEVVGDSKNIPSECVISGDVLLLVLWRDTESQAACPTQSQVHSLEMKLKRPPGWWVEVPNQTLLYAYDTLWTKTERI